MLAWLAGLLTNKVAQSIFSGMGDALGRLRDAKTEEERIKASVELGYLEANAKIIQAEQQSKITSWIRPALALPVVIFWFKVIVYDTVLGLGVTPYPGEGVMWYVTLVPTAYFLVRPFEKWKS